ncbi:MAG: hypothetical protein WCW31_04770 [Patescibacteria group bacterium]|jgi:predicted  nucleic acid-binding Zn-ribbon protein
MEKRTPKKRNSELSELRQEMRQGFLQSRQETDDLRKEMRQGFLKTEEGFLHARQETDDLRKEMHQGFLKSGKETEELRTSVQDILDAVGSFATHVEENFAEIRQDVAGLKSEIGGIKASMVTKSYLDEKLGNNYGNAVAMVRKEDVKVDSLTQILAKKKVLSKIEAKEVVHMGPFPKA